MPGIYVEKWPDDLGPSPYQDMGSTWVPGVQRVQNAWNWSQNNEGIVYFDVNVFRLPKPYYQPLIRFDDSIQPVQNWPVKPVSGVEGIG